MKSEELGGRRLKTAAFVRRLRRAKEDRRRRTLRQAQGRQKTEARRLDG